MSGGPKDAWAAAGAGCGKQRRRGRRHSCGNFLDVASEPPDSAQYTRASEDAAEADLSDVRAIRALYIAGTDEKGRQIVVLTPQLAIAAELAALQPRHATPAGGAAAAENPADGRANGEGGTRGSAGDSRRRSRSVGRAPWMNASGSPATAPPSASASSHGAGGAASARHGRKGSPGTLSDSNDGAALDLAAHLESEALHRVLLLFVQELDELARRPYVLVFCNTDFTWLKWSRFSFLGQLHALLPRRHRKNIQRLIVLHPTPIFKMFYVFARLFVQSKFYRKITYCDSVTELLRHLPRTAVQGFPEDVFRNDLPDFVSKGVIVPVSPASFGLSGTAVVDTTAALGGSGKAKARKHRRWRTQASGTTDSGSAARGAGDSPLEMAAAGPAGGSAGANSAAFSTGGPRDSGEYYRRRVGRRTSSREPPASAAFTSSAGKPMPLEDGQPANEQALTPASIVGLPLPADSSGAGSRRDSFKKNERRGSGGSEQQLLHRGSSHSERRGSAGSSSSHRGSSSHGVLSAATAGLHAGQISPIRVTKQFGRKSSSKSQIGLPDDEDAVAAASGLAVVATPERGGTSNGQSFLSRSSRTSGTTEPSRSASQRQLVRAATMATEACSAGEERTPAREKANGEGSAIERNSNGHSAAGGLLPTAAAFGLEGKAAAAGRNRQAHLRLGSVRGSMAVRDGDVRAVLQEHRESALRALGEEEANWRESSGSRSGKPGVGAAGGRVGFVSAASASAATAIASEGPATVADFKRRSRRLGRRVPLDIDPPGPVFGVPLVEMVAKTPHLLAPWPVRRCVEFLDRHLDSEGLFRLAGSGHDLAQLRAAIESGLPICWDPDDGSSSASLSALDRSNLASSNGADAACLGHPGHGAAGWVAGSWADRSKSADADSLGGALEIDDVNTVAQLLKAYFRELPDPLVPFQTYPNVIAIARAAGEADERWLSAAKALLWSIPAAHYNCARYLFSFLQRVAGRSADNRMTPENLAIVFAPNLIRPENEDPFVTLRDLKFQTDTVMWFIEHYDILFGEDF